MEYSNRFTETGEATASKQFGPKFYTVENHETTFKRLSLHLYQEGSNNRKCRMPRKAI